LVINKNYEEAMIVLDQYALLMDSESIESRTESKVMKAEALKLKAVCVFMMKSKENYFEEAIKLLGEA
jgi:hypothetical protein